MYGAYTHIASSEAVVLEIAMIGSNASIFRFTSQRIQPSARFGPNIKGRRKLILKGKEGYSGGLKGLSSRIR